MSDLYQDLQVSSFSENKWEWGITWKGDSVSRLKKLSREEQGEEAGHVDADPPKLRSICDGGPLLTADNRH